MDVAFTELSELYLEANDIQKKNIFDYSATAKLPYNLWYFVLRIGKLIQSKDDDKWLRIGIAAALIDGARADFRELIVSLVILRFVAELHGIDTKPFFDEAIRNTDDKINSVLINAREHEDSDVHSTVQSFGWPELIEESKNRFGDHSSIAEQSKKREENQKAGPAREINCSTIVVVVSILIVGLVVIYFVLAR